MSNWFEIVTDPKTGQRQKIFNLHPAQTDVLTATEQYVALIAGSGIGKTVVGALFLLKHIAENPEATFIALSPTYRMLSQASLPTFEQAIADTAFEGDPRLGFGWREGRKEYLLPQGGRILFRSAENIESIEGVHITGAVWMDEAGMMSPKAFHIVQKRCRYNSAQVFIGSTPYPKQLWLKTEVLDRRDEPNYYVRTACSLENPHFPREQYEEAKRTLPEWRWKMDYLGEFCGASGQVYPEMNSCFVEMPDELPDGVAYGGIDLGGGGSTSCPFVGLCGILDSDDVLWVFWERRKKGADLISNATCMRDFDEVMRERGTPVERWWADASRPDYIRALKRCGLSITKAPNNAGSVQLGIDLVTSRIRLGKLKIVIKNCAGIDYEWQRYAHRVEDDGEIFEASIVKRYCDSLDALRYLVMGVDKHKSPLDTYSNELELTR